MKYDPHKHHRRSIRLKGYDYSRAGAYFVTICMNDGQNHLGEVVDGEMVSSKAGLMVLEVWESLKERFPNIERDVFVLMPNHIHFVVFIFEKDSDAKQNLVVLGNVIGAFKSITTNKYIDGVREQNWAPFYKRFWLRNYWERIVRNERELEAIRGYVLNNPAKWEEDKLHPNAEDNKFNQEFER